MILETIKTFFLQLRDVFLRFQFIPDFFDILLVALLIYAVIVQLRKTKSIQVIRGILLVVVVYGLVALFGMSASSYLFRRLFNDIILIVIVLFADELRQALENVGKRRFGVSLPFFRQANEDAEVDAINAVCRACGAMSRNKIGSLILFQRNTLLGDLTKQAVMIDSQTTFEMLCSIFYPKAPLHDGAVIIKDGRIVAARCVVPMKNDRVMNENVGTRHRAALEASLNSDCVAVVTSEETGIISVAVEGNLQRGLTDSELREVLGQYLLSPAEKPIKRLARVKKGAGEPAAQPEKVPEKVPEKMPEKMPEKVQTEKPAEAAEETPQPAADALQTEQESEATENA